jgi:hypothetical protein
MIRKEGTKYALDSRDGKKKLGTFSVKKEAQASEQHINYFKHVLKGGK